MKKLSLLLLLSCLIARNAIASDETCNNDQEGCNEILDSGTLRWIGDMSEEGVKYFCGRFYACAQKNQEKAETLLKQNKVTGKGMRIILKNMLEKGFPFSTDFLTFMQRHVAERMELRNCIDICASIDKQIEQKRTELYKQIKELDTQAHNEKNAQCNVIAERYERIRRYPNGIIHNCEQWSMINGKVNPEVYELCGLHNSMAATLK